MDEFGKYKHMREQGADAHGAYLTAKKGGLDKIPALKMLREVYGLSLEAAKRISIEVDTGKTTSEWADDVIRAIDFTLAEFITLSDDPASFYAYHAPALEENEARHTMLLGLMPQNSTDLSNAVRLWTVGDPGACAMLTSPDRPILLGDLNERQCHALAEEVHATEFAGVIGSGEAPRWFASRARELGLKFKEPFHRRIHEIGAPPVFPGSPGSPRLATPADIDVYVDWTLAFQAEAVPDDPQPSREYLEQRLAKGTTLFWVDGEPVSMAASVRQTRRGASIAPVYTPPEYRRCGYAGSVTAALVQRLFADGRTMVCLYTDVHNIASNRCYANVGFTPVCDAWHYVRCFDQ